MPDLRQPAVVGNDWTALAVPELGGWPPTMTVSVVIPAHDPGHLEPVLAGLSAQSYPAHLLEVVVVDDGSEPAVVLPEVRPENTRLVRLAAGSGPGAARIAGVEQSDGEVLHWLDADMVPRRSEVEAHLRWHHVIDYAVVLGDRVFTADDALAHLAPDELAAAVRAGAHPDELARGETAPNAWVHQILSETDGLANAGPRAMRLHVTASSSVTRSLYEAAGGFPADVRFGEDTVLGYRLREAGAVFVPDPEAVSAHLGQSRVNREQERVNRFAKPFVTDLVPEYRGHRLVVPRSYTVPYVEVLVPVGEASFEQVAALVHAQLTCSVPDVVVTLVAPWQRLAEERVDLGSPTADRRMLAAAFGADPRVRLVERPRPLSDATFRMSLPDAHLTPTGTVLEDLLFEMESGHLEAMTVDVPDGSATLVRTAALARNRRVTGEFPAGGLPDAAVRRSSERRPATGWVSPGDVRPRQVRGLVGWGVR